MVEGIYTIFVQALSLCILVIVYSGGKDEIHECTKISKHFFFTFS